MENEEIFFALSLFFFLGAHNAIAYPAFTVDSYDYGDVPFSFNGHNYKNFVLTAGSGGSTVLIYNYFDENVVITNPQILRSSGYEKANIYIAPASGQTGHYLQRVCLYQFGNLTCSNWTEYNLTSGQNKYWGASPYYRLCFTDDYFRASFNFTFQYAFTGLCGVGDTTVGQTYYAYNPQLTIIVDPVTGGAVTSDPAGIDCPDTSCQANFTINSDVDITATASTDWAFAYWDNGTTCLYDNPLTVTMDWAKTLTAVFFRTFRNAVGDFQITTGDECVIYVRNETDILYAACNGEAADCFDQAQTAGYDTGQTPKEGAIIVFDRVPETALDVGHVAIVTNYNGDQVSMHDSNWVGYHAIGDHTETIGTGGYAIKGYIYYTPNQQ